MHRVEKSMQGIKPDLVIFSPLPPVENGIADYCAELLPELAIDYSLILVIDNHVPRPIFRENWTVIHLAEFMQRESEFVNANYLYHVGNNPDHEYIIPVLLKHPGILVLHDISLHHLVNQMTIRWGMADAYCELLEREYGNLGRTLAMQFRTNRTMERIAYYELPMIRLIASRCRAIIVHSWYGKTKVLAQEPDVPVEVILHHLANSAVEAQKSTDKEAARDFLGVEQDELLLVSLGFITKAKQIDVVFEVLARCRHQLPKIRYILAGQDQPQHYDIRASIKAYGLEDIVEVTGYLEEEEFYIYSIAADIVINLRYPTGGETSGTLIRALGIGACVMVVDIGPFAEFPDETCIKIPWSETFDIAFMEALLDLAKKPEKRFAIGQRAKHYLQSRHSLQSSGAAYRRIIEKFSGYVVPTWSMEQISEYPTLAERESILSRVKLPSIQALPLWFREMQFPLATSVVNRDTLVVGDEQAKELLCGYLGYDPVCVKILPSQLVEARLSDFPRRSAVRAIFAPTHYPNQSEFHDWLVAFNRILELDAVFLVSSSALWPTASSEIRQLIIDKLQATGFRLVRYLASPQDFSFVTDVVIGKKGVSEPRYYYPCWLATKISEFIEPVRTQMAYAVDVSGEQA